MYTLNLIQTQVPGSQGWGPTICVMLVLKLESHCPSSSSFKNSVSHLQPSQSASNPVSFPHPHLVVAFLCPEKIKAAQKEPPLYIYSVHYRKCMYFNMYFIPYFCTLPTRREILRSSKRRYKTRPLWVLFVLQLWVWKYRHICVIKTPNCTNLIKLNEPRYMTKWKYNHMEKLL